MAVTNTKLMFDANEETAPTAVSFYNFAYNKDGFQAKRAFAASYSSFI